MVLTFAASDPTGGAGVQADLLTIAALDCHPLSVITGLTVQDTRGVARMMAVESEWVRSQAQHLVADMKIAAIKSGVLASAANVRVVTEIAAGQAGVPVVVDPVLASGRGDPLAADDVVDAIRKYLLARTTVVTPNSIEARRLGGESNLAACARRLLDCGCKYVLITGTHEATEEVVNTFYDAAGVVREDCWPRLPGEYHGSGCTLASAIAATVANGLSVSDAVKDAQEYTWQTLKAGFRPGMGQHIPDRLFWAREDEPANEPG
jgi:hydroxymethylpyrimidine/phosphomethylpyrimidine kinase